MTDIPYIKPINIPEYKYKQSKYEMTPKLPFRSIVVPSSAGGKTVLIQNRLLNIYRGSLKECIYSRLQFIATLPYTKSKKYQKEVMKVDEERCFRCQG